MEDPELIIRFGRGIANLYDVGYLATDIQQLITFAEMVSELDLIGAEKYFGNKAKGLNRYAKPLEKYHESSQIIDARKGSVELILTGMSLLASIIVPIMVVRIQQRLQQDGLEDVFEISSKDENLKKHFEAYKNGQYGDGSDGLNRFFEILSKIGYNITTIRANSFRIQSVADKYAGRMVKTITRSRVRS